MRRRRARHRRGSIYVLVLAVSLIISVIGVTAMATARLSQRASQGTLESYAAESLAMAGIDHALHAVIAAMDAEASSGDWRLEFTHGEVRGPFAFGSGNFTWVLLDEKDGDLRDDSADAVTMVAEGTAGAARFRLSAQLEPESGTAPLSCLDSSLTAGGFIAFNGCTLESEATVNAAGSVNAFSSHIRAPVEAAGLITGSAYLAGTTALGSARELPLDSVFTYYLARGTPLIDNHGNGPGTIEDVLLSPSVNPFGEPNPEGIYIVDCDGGDLRIRDCRIVGTIVAINVNPAKEVEIDGEVNWEPAVTGYPALLVEGSLEFDLDSTPLLESEVGVNLNPVGTPYREVEDDQLNDSYPSLLGGIFYASSSVHFGASDPPLRLLGIILAGGNVTSDFGVEIFIARDADQVDLAPPGFTTADGRMKLVPGSWKRLVD